MSYVEIYTGDEIERISSLYWTCRGALLEAYRLNAHRVVAYEGCYSYVWRAIRGDRVFGKQTYRVVAYQNLLERL